MRAVVFLLAGKLDFSNIDPMPLNPLELQKSRKKSRSLPLLGCDAG